MDFVHYFGPFDRVYNRPNITRLLLVSDRPLTPYLFLLIDSLRFKHNSNLRGCFLSLSAE